ncbi:hypothetical protein BCF33_2736 [Hasllibacter halocynthiae]|uniref:Photosynthetic complex assembly protein n=1 Tax=Hasllibacter halocynthiae TaxID=595589 RepID=A0A2T0WZB4_9RHOB|nr:hypothetical protein [Hasllibacter halocynthiae]PRY92043.1 hypothetical protein BCF33_2736 [Hasllibacter halocynthiae]
MSGAQKSAGAPAQGRVFLLLLGGGGAATLAALALLSWGAEGPPDGGMPPGATSAAPGAWTASAVLRIAEGPAGTLRVTPPAGAPELLRIDGDLFAITALRGAAGWLNHVPSGGEGRVLLLRHAGGGLFAAGADGGPEARLVALDAFGADNRRALERFLPPEG